MSTLKRPWHIPGPWPQVSPPPPVSRDDLPRLIAEAESRHSRRTGGAE